MATLAEALIRQRRFKHLLVMLLVMSACLGVVIVPIEQREQGALITNFYDGIWWATTTITSVGYGDLYPVTALGKLIGMILEISGVLAFGLLISIVTVAIEDPKERYYRQRLFERLDLLEKKLQQAEKRDEFVMKKDLK